MEAVAVWTNNITSNGQSSVEWQPRLPMYAGNKKIIRRKPHIKSVIIKTAGVSTLLLFLKDNFGELNFIVWAIITICNKNIKLIILRSGNTAESLKRNQMEQQVR